MYGLACYAAIVVGDVKLYFQVRTGTPIISAACPSLMVTLLAAVGLLMWTHATENSVLWLVGHVGNAAGYVPSYVMHECLFAHRCSQQQEVGWYGLVPPRVLQSVGHVGNIADCVPSHAMRE